ncbi:M48 family metallopeptidase [Pedosphaera parvula]|nr:M48 family metallopeptidase [Pedosphaera parvula]
MRYLFFTIICLFFSRIGIAAEQLPALQGTPSSVTSQIESVDETLPVAVPEPSAKALAHYRSGTVLWCIRTIWELWLPILFLFTGFSARLREFARKIGRHWFWAMCIYFVVLVVLNYLLSLPLAYFQGFIRPHAYNLSNQTLAKWFTDSLKELGLVLVLGCLFLWIPYLLLKKSPRRWWLYASLAMVPIYFFVVMIQPVVMAPMFNQFTPVKDKALEAKIMALAERAGIHGAGIYEVNKSVDTKTANAYVSGFLGTKRIVLWDTIIAQLNERELMFVLGHEMGHYALNHVVKGILCLSVLTLVAFYGVHVAASFLLRRFSRYFGFDQLSDLASLPLLVLLINVFSLVLTPIGFAYSRHLEHEADRFGLELTHYNHSAGTGFVKLQQQSLGVPWPGLVYTIWRATHPSNGERVEFFNEYKPWLKHEPSRYEAYFTPEQPKK